MKAIWIWPSNLGHHHIQRFEALDQAGIELIVVRQPVNEYHRPWSAEPPEGATYTVVDAPSTASLPDRVSWYRGLYRRSGAHCLVTTGYTPQLALPSLVAAQGLPIARHLYLVGFGGQRHRGIAREALKSLSVRRSYDSVLAVGLRARDYAVSMGFHPKSVHVIGNAFDTAHFRCGDELPERSGIGYLGRLADEKGLDVLLRAFDLYSSAGGSQALHIAGAGPLEEMVRDASETREIEVADWVDYDDVPAYLQSLRCLVVPSREEPWGLVVGEALAAGTIPVVARAVGAAADLVVDGLNGYLVPDDDPDALARALHSVDALDSDQRDSMGRLGMRSVAGQDLGHWANSVTSWLRRAGSRRGTWR